MVRISYILFACVCILLFSLVAVIMTPGSSKNDFEVKYNEEKTFRRSLEETLNREKNKLIEQYENREKEWKNKLIEQYEEKEKELKKSLESVTAEKEQLKNKPADPCRDTNENSEKADVLFGHTPDDVWFKPVPTKKEFDQLPRHAIVMYVDAFATKYYKSEVSSWTCYAAMHGLNFYVETQKMIKNNQPHHNKQKLLQKYLPHFQWVSIVDCDTFVVNRTKKFTDYLDDKYDLILNMREISEIFSGLVTVKNSEFGRNFSSEWLAMAHQEPLYNKEFPDGARRLNTDNGDIILWLLTRFTHNEKVKECIDVYYDQNQGDFWAHYHKFATCAYYAYYLTKAYEKWDNILVTDIGDKRTMVRTGPYNWGADQKLVLNTDFIIHGKNLMNVLKPEEVVCSKDTGDRPLGLQYMTEKETRDWAIHNHYYQHPLCMENGVNVCKKACDPKEVIENWRNADAETHFRTLSNMACLNNLDKV
ncbi:hypothetical protein AKO1_008163 [Acrasis kona]|uniref:Nucleotide-diphospho-sugar transferase domain-containing protein n=1 Tax=Acrasis kona TaxID=1008807 RepID=A0AAW2YNN9_9EUKA